MGAKSVVLIVDASKKVNSRVFHWAKNGLSLKHGDKITLVAVLHRLSTPMGYVSNLTESNERFVEIEAARRREAFHHNEELIHISKLYESEKVEFRIELVIGSLIEVASNKAMELNATWVILDRQMKKDTQYILQKLSCGISRLKRKNKIEHLRGPPILPSEIQCISHETFNESLPEEVESVEGCPKSPIKVDQLQPSDEQGKIKRNPDKEDDSTFTITNNQLGITKNLTSQTELDELSITKNPTSHTKPDDLTVIDNPISQSKPDDLTIINNPTSQTKLDELRMVQEECNSEQLIGQTKDVLLVQDQKQIHMTSQEDIRDGKQEKSIYGNSKCSICSMFKSRRPSSGWEKDFTYREIEVATDGFSAKNSLSEAGYGPFFKGQLECALKIAVKQHQLTDSQAEKQMMSQVQLILKARHKNVAMLLGSSTQEGQLLTVYEYACNGSLDKYLSKENCRPLSWGERVKIAVGLSRGLKYLYENNIIHGNIKPSTILLNHDFEPMLGDFSFGKIKLELKSHKDRKSFGYIAPELKETGKLSTKTDVYAFGVVMLELITGKRATDKISGEKSLVEWAKPFLRGKKYPQLVDTKISSSYKEDQLQWLIQVAEHCLKKNPKERSSMNVVVSELQGMEDIDSSPEKSYLPDCASGTTSSQGQTMDDQLSWEEEQIESIPYEEERSLRPKTRNNDITDHTKPYQIKENQEDTEAKIMLEDSKTFACSICKTKRPNIRSQTEFTYDELQAATEGFSIKNSLCEDAYGPAFKAQLKCNLKVVVKQLQMTSSHEEKTFKSEVQLLTRARHENVVMLLGSCIQETKLLIVYENACNGSLDQYLSGGSYRSLTWRERMKIALGVCKGLKYLHDNNIIHGSIKPSNILLTHEFESLVGDFGFGNSRNELKDWHKNKKIMNPGYTAPEFMESGKLSTKTDVYSFGIVLLELITGHRAIDKISGQKSLVEWAKPLLSGRKYPQLMDQKISGSCDDQELLSLVQVIEQCLRKNPKIRLTMNMIISALPCIVANKPFVAKDSPAKLPHLTSNSSDVPSSQDRAELPAKGDLSRGISRESENYETCSSSGNKKTKVRQKNTSDITCCGSNEETLETERFSTEIHQEGQRNISCGSAKIFFHGGAREYIVDEQFFGLCNPF